MQISDNLSSPSININKNDFRVPQSKVANDSNYKDAFKLDINPRYLQEGMQEEVLLADTDVLFYNKNLFITNKSY